MASNAKRDEATDDLQKVIAEPPEALKEDLKDVPIDQEDLPMNMPDLSTYSAEDLLALIAVANAQLQQRKDQHIADGQKLGLAYVDEDGAPKRKRRNSKHHAEE